MPLPIIFKFLSDTSGLKYNEVTDGMDNIKVSSQKAGQAIKSFASIIRSGQEPVTALADSVGNLTRAFGLGIGATIAVVGIVEAIKSFIAESTKLNQVSEQATSAIKAFQESAGSLDLGGAIAQTKALGKAFDEARSKIGERSDILGKVGKTIADAFFGGSKERAENSLQNLKAAQGQAKFAASIALDKRIEAMETAKASKFAAQNLAITEKYKEERRKAYEIGLSENEIRKLDILEIEELRKVEMARLAERGAELEEQIKQEKRGESELFELRQKNEEKINSLRKQGMMELSSGIEEINKKRLSGASPLLDRVVQAAQTLGIGAIPAFVERQRKVTEKGLAERVLSDVGVGPSEITAGGRLFRSGEERLQSLLGVEAEAKRLEDERLVSSVFGIEQAVNKLAQTIEDKLGVPILRSAAGT